MSKIVNSIKELRDVFSDLRLFDFTSKKKEVWIDHLGNECFYRDNGTISCRTVNNEPSLTVQSEKDSCDINLIVERHLRTGIMTNYRTSQPMYGDFTSCVDYHEAVARAQQAEESFMTLPASIRARFSNDPGQLIDFLSNENNRSEAIKLGLVTDSQASRMPQETVAPATAGAGQESPTSNVS